MCSPFSSAEDNPKREDLEQAPMVYDDLSRRDVRSLIFHFLYAADAFNYEESIESIIISFNHGFDLNVPLKGELATTVENIIEHRNELEKVYEPYLANWRSERISVCTKLILLFAVWEFKNSDTDARIIINEAIELAKCFAEEDAYRFINGILDSVSKEFRKESNNNTES
jgi:transcription antitermination protein NusB